MFIKTKNSFNEEILVNTDRINYVVKQNDGDVFIHFGDAKDHIKVSNSFFETLTNLEE